jgi:hypothetical protein
MQEMYEMSCVCYPEEEDEEMDISQAINTDCSIYLSDTIELPVILDACRHAFCLKCIEGLQQYSLSIDLPSVSCPLCRAVDENKFFAEALLEKALMLAKKTTSDTVSDLDKIK